MLAVPQTPVMRAPIHRASCTALAPTAPEAPVIRIDWPLCSPAMSVSDCKAVPEATGKLAASSSVKASGVGASAVQLARWLGARISGVCGTANIDYVRSIGAEHVIDYKIDNWLELDQHFDVIFDAAAAASFSKARPRLTANGVYINTMPGAALYWAAIVARATSRQRCVPFLLKTDAALLQQLAKLAAGRVIVPNIHEIVDFAQVASAQRRMQEGKVHGKVCVRVDA